MAQLPPKLTNFMHQDSHQHQQPQCQDFMHPHHHESQKPPWVNEFIEFSEAKRGASRGVLSDSSGAFVEAGHNSFLDRPLNITDIGKVNNEDEFDKFDDEQFMSLFSNELGMSSSDPSSTSDHNSTNEDKKRKATFREEKMLKGWENVEDGDKAEVESLHKFDNDQGRVQPLSGGERSDQGGNVATNGSSGGCTKIGGVEQQGQQSTIDPKRVKRILANRQSAQRSRVRKLQYISELERSVTTLQSEVSALSPRVAFLDHQRMILTVDNSTLKAKIAALAQDKIFKDTHQEAMKREIERLRQVYYQQNINQTDNTISPSPSLSLPPSTAQPPPLDHTTHENENFNG